MSGLRCRHEHDSCLPTAVPDPEEVVDEQVGAIGTGALRSCLASGVGEPELNSCLPTSMPDPDAEAVYE